MDSWIDASAWVLPVLLAVTLHEMAHGWMASRFGDDTAKMLGRISPNPLRHIDHFGTILLPATLLLVRSPVVFGYARPVPVNFSRLQPPMLGMFMVALAGPATNVILAIIAGLLLHIDHFITPEQAPWVFENLYRALMINCALAVFNMIPILPLDGGRVLYALLRGRVRQLYGRLEKYGIPIVMIALLVPPLFGVAIVQQLMTGPAYGLLQGVLWITGNVQ